MLPGRSAKAGSWTLRTSFASSRDEMTTASISPSLRLKMGPSLWEIRVRARWPSSPVRWWRCPITGSFEGLGGKLELGFVRDLMRRKMKDVRRRRVVKLKKKNITKLQVIVEIACASSPHHLVAVRQAYCSLYHISLEEDIISNVPLPVQKILVSLVSSYRYDKEVVDSSIAREESAKLRLAVGAKQVDDEELLRVLSTRNVFQLKRTFQQYKDDWGTSIDKDILACGKGIVELVVKVVIWCLDSPEKHFAEVVRAAIIGLGTDEDSLSRAIVARAEIDMMQVKDEYINANKCSLESAVIGDTSGDYKDFLMTLLGADV